MNYLLLAIPSAIETQRLLEDFTEHPGEPMHTPHWGNAVHASLVTAVTDPPAMLSESLLSESPLPESPLPESPLPESPLPESPLPESMGAARR